MSSEVPVPIISGMTSNRINGGLRPPAFSAFAGVLHLQIITEALEKFKIKARDRVYQVWKRNPLSVSLYTQAVFKQKLHYIHANPVVAGLRKFPGAYKYSSAAFYEKGISEWNFLTYYNASLH